MAVANHNNGLFIGKVGNTVSYMLNGQYVMRTIGKYKGKRSIKQLANMMSMKVTTSFLSSVQSFIDVGFGLEAMGTNKNAFNLATSAVKKNAVKGEYPNLSIDYSKVLLSRGTVPAPEGVSISKTDQGVLIKWEEAPPGPLRRGQDGVMVLVYFPEQNFSLATFHAGKRKDGSCCFEVPKSYLHKHMEVYISFRQSDGKAVSDSVYAGNLNAEHETVKDIENNKRYTETKQRFDVIDAILKKKLILSGAGMIIYDKQYRHLIKEYEVLREKLKNMPGKSRS
ncbi:hypothetical protein PBAL39_25270 [Pedobacter sp. BAL39]|uniref:DUF6266 family protein n=1 Tax=Pedobacter sp. BAL39 TaxID=391596 RepID=UPI00015592F2|nr:DUF6266 family protein [Pedobacter sp. BAL39]EDM36640.1 hypothetical protein PBAL39_25270 [Pedobacter sp. BAL39]